MMDSIKEKAKVTSKNQITLPKAVRDILKVEKSDSVEFTILPTGSITIRKEENKNEFWDKVFEQEAEYGSIATNEIDWGEDVGAENYD